MASRHRSRPLAQVILEGVARIFGLKHEEHTIELNHGQHEIEIETSQTPARVWINFGEGHHDLPVCMGSVDTCGVQIVEKGFILYANIASTSRHIRWFASLS